MDYNFFLYQHKVSIPFSLNFLNCLHTLHQLVFSLAPQGMFISLFDRYLLFLCYHYCKHGLQYGLFCGDQVIFRSQNQDFKGPNHSHPDFCFYFFFLSLVYLQIHIAYLMFIGTLSQQFTFIRHKENRMAANLSQGLLHLQNFVKYCQQPAWCIHESKSTIS